MAYTAKQKKLRRCKWIKADKTQRRGYSKIDSDYCSLHSYDHKTKKLPKSEAERRAAAYRRAMKRAEPQRRAVCNCSMMPYPHRFSSSGACPDAPVTQAKRASTPRVTVRKSGDDERESRTERGKEREKVSDKLSRDAGGDKYLRDLGVVVREDDDARRDWQRQVNQQTAEEQTHYESLMSKIWSGKV